MNPAHAPATSAIRNENKTVLLEQSFSFGPSFEGIELLSRTIMTGKA